MAVISPTGLVAARSPLFITWDGTGIAASNINYFKLEIYAWSGEEASKPASPIYTIDRQSGFVDSYPTADIAPLLENEFLNRVSKLHSDSVVTNSPDSQLFVQVDYDIEYISLPGPFIVNDTGSTEIFIATYGYGKFTEGANHRIQGPFLQEKMRYAYEKDAFMLPIYLGLHGEGLDIIYGYRDRVVADGGTVESLSCANIGLKAIKVLNDNGTSYQYAVTESNVYETKAEERVLLFPAGIANLSNFKTNNSFGGAEPYNTKYYDVQLLNGFDDVIDEVRIYNECEPKYDPVMLYFVNRYGCWDNITFLKKSEKTLNLQKETYRSVIGSSSSSGYTWGNQARGLRSYNHQVNHSMVLNTGFVSEDYGEVMEQLLMSEYVLMVYDRTTERSGTTYDISQSQRAVNINTESLTLQKHVNDKTINYTIQIEMANPENAML